MLVAPDKRPPWAVVYTRMGSKRMWKVPELGQHETPEKAIEATTAWLATNPHLCEKYKGGEFRLMFIAGPYTVKVA